MESISIFDIFKIGVGPSSSHTLGPWNAALDFLKNIEVDNIDTIHVHLYGSLSKTGIGHATDKAVLLGLMGYLPKTIDTNSIDGILEKVKNDGFINIQNHKITFSLRNNIVFENSQHPLHPNTLIFRTLKNNTLQKEEIYASVGGGFIEKETSNPTSEMTYNLPYPIQTGNDLLNYTKKLNCSISNVVYKNELSIRKEAEIDANIELLITTIFDCIYTGCTTEGILPGGLNVNRRAKNICDRLLNQTPFSSKDELIALIKKTPKSFNAVNKWVSCFALAVNEQNAAMGRVVTSPTNGAAGVIPSVMMYYVFFCDYKGIEELKKFLFTAGEIGCLFKKGATISAAVGGCQAEIGVSSAMAAGALTELLGGSPAQCLMAAEIAMEHHLGLTCDPIKGLVQVPCIERNAMGAMKAITASNLALESDANKAIVNLDTAIKTMWDVSVDMNSKYKETSEGGLAINLPVINPSC